MVDRGFGQGASSGDFDNDGFPDLYVGNVGRNQLLHNNGDGTFTDVTDVAGLTATDWTTSCVIVDLNADGNPDLYDVNYVTGPQVYERICQGKGCSPSAFAGAPDHLLLSRGDGSFELIEPAAPEVDGKGLGIVAFDLHERGRPSLFVANDQVPNFLLRNLATGDRHNVRLEDEAFISGVAFNQDGLAMASMGSLPTTLTAMDGSISTSRRSRTKPDCCCCRICPDCSSSVELPQACGRQRGRSSAGERSFSMSIAMVGRTSSK